ncbi:MAG: ATP synthase F1 subunit epsilon [Prevotellaceae bacterium]|jgi:F-type H+-transporting ATPase subunit epsilon|nr:ATP synthase F1 subunit epsilon [Prevotellaceae bacterium]
MKLIIISPEKTLFKGEVSLVQVPGKKGQFTVLNNHAPIISSLGKGSVVYKTAEKEETIEVSSGLIEVNKNVVTVCVE